jgi:hypothetical protein
MNRTDGFRNLIVWDSSVPPVGGWRIVEWYAKTGDPVIELQVVCLLETVGAWDDDGRQWQLTIESYRAGRLECLIPVGTVVSGGQIIGRILDS